MNQELESTTLSINSSNETEQIKQKRKRRTKAEMEESRKQEIIKDNKIFLLYFLLPQMLQVKTNLTILPMDKKLLTLKSIYF